MFLYANLLSMKKNFLMLAAVLIFAVVAGAAYLYKGGLGNVHPALLSESFLNNLSDRHPEGKTYAAEAIKAQSELKDDDSDNDFAAILNTAVQLNLLGEKQMALEWYKSALKTDPTNVLALNNMANIYDELGNFAESEKAWLLLIEVYPYKTQFWRSLGYLYRFKMNKSSEEIEALFARGLKETNNDGDIANWLLTYFLETGNNAKFVEYANKLKPSPASSQ